MTTETPAQKGSGSFFKILLAGVIILAGAYGVYSIYGGKSNKAGVEKHATTKAGDVTAASDGITKKLSVGDLRAFLVHKQRKKMPVVAFKNGKGADLTLENWKGKVVLVNLWATWCGPCRKEMPHLAELQKAFGGDDFEVVAISVDRKGVKASGRFLVEAKATALNLYVDQSAHLLRTLRTVGLPLTVLVDRQGREVGRLLGPAVWNGKDAYRLIKTALAEKS